VDWRPGKKVALSTALRVCPAAAGLFHSLRFYASAASMHRWLGTSRRGAECTKCGSSPLLLSLVGVCRPSHRMSQGHPLRTGARLLSVHAVAPILCTGSVWARPSFGRGLKARRQRTSLRPRGRPAPRLHASPPTHHRLQPSRRRSGTNNRRCAALSCVACTSGPHIVSSLN